MSPSTIAMNAGCGGTKLCQNQRKNGNMDNLTLRKKQHGEVWKEMSEKVLLREYAREVADDTVTCLLEFKRELHGCLTCPNRYFCSQLEAYLKEIRAQHEMEKKEP